MKSTKGIIFDLDGVIVDTAKFHYLAWRKLANDLGFDISLKQNEKLKGVSRIDSLQKILGWGGKSVSNSEFERLMATKNEDYLERIAHLNEEDLLPGVKKVLDYLTENEIPYALGSASKNARPIIQGLKIENRFKAVVDGNDVTKPKPDPQVFLIAAEKMSIPPKDCVVFEDSLAGIEAANSAGMLSIGIGDPIILKNADYNFHDFTEIDIDFIEKVVRK